MRLFQGFSNTVLEWANLRFVTLQNNLAKIIRKSGRHFIFKDAYQSGDINTTFLWGGPTYCYLGKFVSKH